MRDPGYYLEDGRYVGPAEQAHLDRAAEDAYWRQQDAVLDDLEWGMKRRSEL